MSKRAVNVKGALGVAGVITIIGLFTTFLPTYPSLEDVTKDIGNFTFSLLKFIGALYFSTFGSLIGISAARKMP